MNSRLITLIAVISCGVLISGCTVATDTSVSETVTKGGVITTRNSSELINKILITTVGVAPTQITVAAGKQTSVKFTSSAQISQISFPGLSSQQLEIEAGDEQIVKLNVPASSRSGDIYDVVITADLEIYTLKLVVK